MGALRTIFPACEDAKKVSMDGNAFNSEGKGKEENGFETKNKTHFFLLSQNHVLLAITNRFIKNIPLCISFLLIRYNEDYAF